MGTLLSRSTWTKISVFHKEVAFFSFETYLYRIFLARIRNQRLRIDPVPNFSSIAQKILTQF